MARQGRYKPRNPQKYLGDIRNICYRSSYELKAMLQIDRDPEVIGWSSEEIVVPYRSPLDNLIHFYFPDLYIEKANGEKFLVEIKPEYQQTPPIMEETKRHKLKKSSIRASINWAKNLAKWESAKKFCEEKGWQFVVYGETELGIPNRR